MSKIDELLKNEKIEWKKLSEIATITGAGVDKKKKLGESPIKLLNYMDVYKHQYINSNIPEMHVTAPDNKIKNCNIERGDIFVTPSSETTDDIFRTAVATEDILNTVYSYHIMRIRLKIKSFITSCYLNYLFQSETFRRDLYKRVFGNTRKTIAKSEIEQIEIPIPSREVQEKIVKTLDNFTNYVTELQAELQARTKQYEYYRDMLLSEEYLDMLLTKPEFEGEGIYKTEWKALGEIGSFQNGTGMPKSLFVEDDGIGAIHYGHIYTKYNLLVDKPIVKVSEQKASNLKKVFPGDLVIAKTSENIEDVMKTVAYVGHDNAVTGGHAAIFRHNENSKYLSYVFNGASYLLRQKNKLARGVKVIELSITDMEKIKIPIPTVKIQEHIVSILDKFYTLLHNSSDGLQKEIELRQKQYEYYREKLLDFKK